MPNRRSIELSASPQRGIGHAGINRYPLRRHTLTQRQRQSSRAMSPSLASSSIFRWSPVRAESTCLSQYRLPQSKHSGHISTSASPGGKPSRAPRTSRGHAQLATWMKVCGQAGGLWVLVDAQSAETDAITTW